MIDFEKLKKELDNSEFNKVVSSKDFDKISELLKPDDNEIPANTVDISYGVKKSLE